MSHSALGSHWKNWVDHNVQRGCDALEMAWILGKHGFRGQEIAGVLGVKAVDLLLSEVDHGRLANIPLATSVNTGGIQQIENDKFQLYSIPNFLSDAECDRLTELVNQDLRPSQVTIPIADMTYRNSQTSDLYLLPDPIVGIVDDRMARTLGIQLTHAEGTQAQRYGVGEQFKQHTDFFEPGTPEYQQFAAKSGNRTWTFMIYLNTVEKGGGTHFYAINKTIMPEKGLAIVWNNLYPDGRVNPNTQHAGLPVEAGCKIIITKWFREFGQGPMFF